MTYCERCGGTGFVTVRDAYGERDKDFCDECPTAPYLTHALDAMWVSALQKARPLCNVLDQDLIQWLDDAIETGTLRFRPSERETRAKSISTLGKRLHKHIRDQQGTNAYEALRVVAFRVAKAAANCDKPGSVKLNTKERALFQQAKEAGPVKGDPEDREWEWLDSAIEQGFIEYGPDWANSRALSGTARAIRVVADRLCDEEAQEKRHEERHIARSLADLAGEVAKKSLILETDLRGISRRSDKCMTTVHVHGRDPWETTRWIVAGEGKLRLDMDPPELQVYLPAGVTDFEHDSGYALRLPLIGVKFEGVRYHRTRVSAYVAPHSPDGFAVPWPGYNPMKHPDAFICGEGTTGYDECRKNPHPIVPEGFYVPPTDLDLYREVEGRRVTICFSVTDEDEE